MTKYQEALRVQEHLHSQCLAGAIPAALVVTEHKPVLTLGKHARSEHLKITPEQLATGYGAELVRTERGGEVTAHMPGQLVMYPILQLTSLGLTVRSYVRLLEQALINALGSIGIEAERDEEHPGVWVRRCKIAALGIRVRQRVSMHGLALNISNERALFDAIVPCGIVGRSVTSVSEVLGRSVAISELEPWLEVALAQQLHTRIVTKRLVWPLPSAAATPMMNRSRTVTE